MTSTATQYSALSRLFSAGVFRELAREGRSPLFARLFNQTNLNFTQGLVGEGFDAAFSTLSKSGMRDEYVYRSAITHNILLGRHSLKTASILTEFRAGSSKADVAILNGTTTVYEIKSDRDSLARLANQLENYRKVFAKIYVVASEAHVPDILRIAPKNVGIMSLVRTNRIRTVREAVDGARFVCPVTIFESLRADEAATILQELNAPVPKVPNTQRHAAMRDCFARLDPLAVHTCMVRTLKRTRSLSQLISLLDQLPSSLKPAALSIQVRKADHQRLVSALQTPIHEAMTWA